MTPLSLSDTDPAELAVDAIVVGLHSSGRTTGPAARAGRGERGGRVRRHARRDPGPARRDRARRRGDQAGHPRHRLRAGDRRRRPRSGARATAAPPARRCAGPPRPRCARWPASAKVALALPTPDGEDAATALRAIAEGALLGTYRFAGYKTKPQPGRRDPVKAVSLHVADAADKAAKAEVKRAAVVVAAVARTRDWINTAPNELRPPVVRRPRSPQAATEAGLEVEVLDEKALKKGGYGGILAVGMGSEALPRLVRIAYTADAAPPRRSPWSARASRSTPAATR